MARKKSASSKSRFSTMIWIVISFLTGGGLGGQLNLNWKDVSTNIQNLKSRASERVANSDIVSSAKEKGGGKLFSTLRNRQSTPNNRYTTRTVSRQRPQDKLLIATFNIQVFGESKLGKPEVVDVLAQVVRHFDIVAIQEVRAKSDDILPRFISAINADGSRYSYLIGPRLGRSVSTEQYAFVYDTTRVEHDPASVGTVQDPDDLLHREPMVARFRPRTNAPDNAFSFWLVNTHTDPDEVGQEVDALADVFQAMQGASPYEDDVILLGDLNANEKQLGRLGQLPGISYVVRNAMTNTRQNKAYDNIIFDGPATSEYTGRWGVVDIERVFGLTRDQALKVSDHLPVWAEFQIWEAPAQRRFTDNSQGYRRSRRESHLARAMLIEKKRQPA